jgi:hypothetical protein
VVLHILADAEQFAQDRDAHLRKMLGFVDPHR